MSTPLTFTKMHGLGNDFVVVDGFTQTVDRPKFLAKKICERRRGVGGDGLVVLGRPGDHGAHARVRFFNPDGTDVEMCGNGLRCAAKLAYDRGWARHNPLVIQTDAGLRTLELTLDSDGKVTEMRVDMGAPILDPRQIPVAVGGERVVDVPVPLPETMLMMTAVSMGNPHAVVFVEDVRRVPLSSWGPMLAKHPLFPRGANVHFAQVEEPDRARMLTWERGAGATQACGTGASAVCVAGVLLNRMVRDITAFLPGGRLAISWDKASDRVFLTGPATEVFTAEWRG